MAKTEPRTLPGFMELLPNEQILFNQMKQSGMATKDFTLQFAKQNNINIEPILNTLSQRGIKL